MFGLDQKTLGNLQDLSKLVPLFLLLLTVIGILIGRFVYGISLLQPLEKIANDQQEYRRKSSQEFLKKNITNRHLQLGKQFLDIGNIKAANQEFKSASAVDSYNQEASLGIFRSQIFGNIENGDFTPEILMKKIDLLFTYSTNDCYAYYFRGILYKSIDFHMAMSDFRKAIIANPSFADAYYQIGMLYETVDELESQSALSFYEKALEISKFNQTYINNIGYQYLQRGEYSKAIRNYELLIKLDADDLLPYLTVAIAHFLDGNYNASCSYADEYILRFQRNDAIWNIELNKKSWYFESFDHTKVALNTVSKKVVYGFLAAYYKNLVAGNNHQAFYTLSKAVEVFFQNPSDNQCVLDLIKFEIKQYVPQVDGVNFSPESILQDIDEAFQMSVPLI